MAIAPGTKLGPYEILALLGAGGMGTVYRARDTRLNRSVAIKIVSDQWRERPDLRARFKVEAEAIAALGHPNICQIYDVGQHGDVYFLVMEFVEGETLADRMSLRRLPMGHALEYSTAIADAIGHAHRRGIVHRDIKPANVVLTAGGPKLLDFGLARFNEGPSEPLNVASTISAVNTRLTQAGVTLGTWHYMAPEQTSGRPADARSDVFALGVVMYEMFAGRRPFEGVSLQELVTAIHTVDPPRLTESDPSTPASVDRIVATCLAKHPDDRWQSGGDVRRALDAARRPINAHAAARRHPTD
jgi:serine/threonine protein kinase